MISNSFQTHFWGLVGKNWKVFLVAVVEELVEADFGFAADFVIDFVVVVVFAGFVCSLPCFWGSF